MDSNTIGLIIMIVGAVVLIWAYESFLHLGKNSIKGNKNGAEPKGIIKANGTQTSDLGAELWAGDICDEIIAEMREKGEW